MKSGLVSVSFRQLKVEEIIKLAKDNNLEYIEWGSGPHVPMGDVKLARKVKKLMHGSGLKCASYGSYYGVTYKEGQHKPIPFKKVCKTAVALGADTIRIWAGWPGCGEISAYEEFKAIIHTREIATIAKKYGLTLAFECHWGTITDDYKHSIEFLNKIGCDNVKIYWQENPMKSYEYNLEALKALLPYATHVHVCNHDDKGKMPLDEAKDKWVEYINLLKAENRVFLLEFMPDGKASSLPTESQTLDRILNEVEK